MINLTFFLRKHLGEMKWNSLRVEVVHFSSKEEEEKMVIRSSLCYKKNLSSLISLRMTPRDDRNVRLYSKSNI